MKPSPEISRASGNDPAGGPAAAWCFFLILWGSLPVLLLAGCVATENFAPGTSPEYMASRPTPLYRYGPMQPGRPETLGTGVSFRLLSRGPGYSRIEFENGTSGYVATEDIRRAPPTGGAVSVINLFPPRPTPVPEPPLPEPDLQMPVEEVPKDAPL